MRSFEGRVWDPVLRRWVKAAPETTQHRLRCPAKLPKRAIDIPAVQHSDKIPDDDNFIIRPRNRGAIVDLQSAARQLVNPGARSREEGLEYYKKFVEAAKRAARLGGKDHPIVRNWLNGQQSVGQLWFNWQHSPSLRELDMADFWIIVTAYDYIREEKERIEEENKRREAENKRRTRFQLNRVYQRLWQAFKSPEFPGPLFVRHDQAAVLDCEEELRLQQEFQKQNPMPRKTFERLQTHTEFRKRTVLPEHQRRSFVALRPDELEELKKGIRKRLGTPQNLYKRLQLLDLIEPPGKRKQRRGGLQRVRRGTLIRRLI